MPSPPCSKTPQGNAYAPRTPFPSLLTPFQPLAYSANGSHALYPTPGTHDHTIPNINIDTALLLVDTTDDGPIFDPLRSANFYSYTTATTSFAPLATTPTAPTAWLNFKGRWGDEEYPASDKRQKDLLGNKKYVGGPTGPWDKGLDRKEVWPANQWAKGQRLRKTLGVGWGVRKWVEGLNCFGKKKVKVDVSGQVVG